GIDAACRAALESELLCSLRAYGKHNRRRIELVQISDRHASVVGHADVTEIVHVGLGKDLGELLTQPGFHLVLGRVDSILRETARLDVPIQDYHLMSGLRDLLRGKHSCWSRAHDEYRLHAQGPWFLFNGEQVRLGLYAAIFADVARVF